jgi:hypothetical protein
MSHHFSMGAINKLTNEYEYPRIAEKGKKYMCPECKKDVNFCKGKIKQPYFAHKRSESPCYYYDKPSESQIHKDAKSLLHKLLTNKTQISFYNICSDCKDKVYGCCELFEDYYTPDIQPIIEYRFEYNDSTKSADVALINSGNIDYIFEICYKNKTRDNARPEPWVEIKAEDFIHDINNGSLLDTNGILHIECMRDSICNECEEKREKDRIYWEEWNRQRVIEEKKRQERIQQQEIERKQKEEEKREQERIKREEYEKKRKEIELQSLNRELEQKQKLQQYYQELTEQNKICDVCKRNYCKCKTSHFLKNKYGMYICLHCSKCRCKCTKITDYFKV